MQRILTRRAESLETNIEKTKKKIVTKAKSFTFQRASRIEIKMFMLISLNDMLVCGFFLHAPSETAKVNSIGNVEINFNDRHVYLFPFL